MKLAIITIIARALHVQMAKWLIAINMMESGVSEKLPAQVFFDLPLQLIVHHHYLCSESIPNETQIFIQLQATQSRVHLMVNVTRVQHIETNLGYVRVMTIAAGTYADFRSLRMTAYWEPIVNGSGITLRRLMLLR